MQPRVVRSTQRRPLSAAVLSHQIISPPRLSRRLSDQPDAQRSRKLEDDLHNDNSARLATYRSLPREKAASAHPGEDLGRAKMATSVLRPSPLTPRALAFQDMGLDGPIYGRRRPSITESTASAPRSSTYRQSNLSYGRTYNPSPLVQQASHHGEGLHGQEGTESSASTAAPSTVWDELDDIKSRIHRLELTGKIPATSGAAMSRVSDERPPTATTTVTTISTSPKRGPGNLVISAQTDSSSTV